jgi:pimeloyl-ACP methyl ester carboxylesterase
MIRLTRRLALLTLAASAALLAGCAQTPSGPAAGQSQPPIVFVHGNGDSAALWTTTLWRWESNGWPRERLHAVNMPMPSARDDDGKEQPGRSSSADQRQHLAAEVDKVLAATGAKQVVLVANSRGGNAVRDCIANGGCAGKVSHAILGGTPNHGVWANPGFRPNNEFNGAGPFLTALNAPKGPNGDEVTPGLRWMTIRSDNNDKFAQPDGVWIGAKGTPTNVTFDSPALKGADNVVLPARDHREVSYHAQAFAQTYRFVTGRAPATTGYRPEAQVVLDGVVTGFTAAGPTNLPAADARVAVYRTSPTDGSRLGAPLVDKTVGADGRWGPVTVDANTPLAFEVRVPGFAITHIYRAPFARSSNIVHLRPERLADADKAAAAVVTLTRPRGYFGVPRDTVLLNGQPAPGIPPGVAGLASAKLVVKEGSGQPVVGEYRSGAINERIVGRSWGAGDNQVSVLELHE